MCLQMTTRFSQLKDRDGDRMSKAAALLVALKHLENEVAPRKRNGQTGSWRVGIEKPRSWQQVASLAKG